MRPRSARRLQIVTNYREFSEAYGTMAETVSEGRRVSVDTGKSLIKFCNSCGAAVTQRIPEGDTLLRAVCDAGVAIDYVNPKIVVGGLDVVEDRILICKRAIEPRYGLWTLPAGFMEMNESASEGA